MRRAIVVAVAALLALPVAASAQSTPDAVVLVSGFTSSTPFTSSAPSCATATDAFATIGPALRAAGYAVSTAPAALGGAAALPAPCTSPGEAVPPSQAV